MSERDIVERLPSIVEDAIRGFKSHQANENGDYVGILDLLSQGEPTIEPGKELVDQLVDDVCGDVEQYLRDHPLAAEIERLRAIVERLPKTADGVSVVPFIDDIWYSDKAGTRELDWLGEVSLADCIDQTNVPRMWKNETTLEDRSVTVADCFSTRQAAESARKGASDGK